MARIYSVSFHLFVIQFYLTIIIFAEGEVNIALMWLVNVYQDGVEVNFHSCSLSLRQITVFSIIFRGQVNITNYRIDAKYKTETWKQQTQAGFLETFVWFLCSIVGDLWTIVLNPLQSQR